MILPTLNPNLRVIVIGASGGIGRAFTDLFARSNQVEHVYALSRSLSGHPSGKVTDLEIDITSQESIKSVSETLKNAAPFDLILIATGLLTGEGIAPEKSMRAITSKGFETSFNVNATGPANVAKYFLPLLRRDSKAVFAALSARVGSITDNRIGGWYAYRASKAALNMIIKTLAIEHARRFKDAVIISLHPGTVDTQLSKPYQGNVRPDTLFTPQEAAQKLIGVIDRLTPQDTGGLFDWKGECLEY